MIPLQKITASGFYHLSYPNRTGGLHMILNTTHLQREMTLCIWFPRPQGTCRITCPLIFERKYGKSSVLYSVRFLTKILSQAAKATPECHHARRGGAIGLTKIRHWYLSHRTSLRPKAMCRDLSRPPKSENSLPNLSPFVSKHLLLTEEDGE